MMEISAIVQAGSDFATFDEVLQPACEPITVEEITLADHNPLVILDMMKKKCKNFFLLRGREHS